MLFDFNRRIVKDIVIENVNFFQVAEKESMEFQRRLDKDLKGDYRKFIINLSACELISPAFIGTIVVLLKRLKEIDGEMKIVIPKEPAKSDFHKTGADKLFNLYRTTEEALESFKLD